MTSEREAVAESLPDNCFLSLNVDPGLLTSERILSILRPRTALAGLVFELTEHRAIADLPAVIAVTDLLKERGALVAMDDAGAGLKQILELRTSC